MAQINFNSIQREENGNSVGFFSLKGDGDEAIVRFAHDTVESFELLTTHDITLNGKFRKVNCIRDPKEPIENCPICASGKKVSQRIFIHLVQYVQDQSTGNIVALPKVWDRPVSYAYKLKSLMDEYGTLSESIFKIKRRGAAGSRETSYDILFCNPSMYNSNMYVKDFSAFETYKSLGTVVLDKNFDELLQYATNGTFPERQTNNDVPNTVQNAVPNAIPNGNTYQEVQTQYNQVQTQYAPPVQQAVTQAYMQPQNNVGGVVPNNFNGQQAVQRPVRQYN